MLLPKCGDAKFMVTAPYDLNRSSGANSALHTASFTIAG